MEIPGFFEILPASEKFLRKRFSKKPGIPIQKVISGGKDSLAMTTESPATQLIAVEVLTKHTEVIANEILTASEKILRRKLLRETQLKTYSFTRSSKTKNQTTKKKTVKNKNSLIKNFFKNSNLFLLTSFSMSNSL